jgi:hypothetical protein
MKHATRTVSTVPQTQPQTQPQVRTVIKTINGKEFVFAKVQSPVTEQVAPIIGKLLTAMSTLAPAVRVHKENL